MRVQRRVWVGERETLRGGKDTRSGHSIGEEDELDVCADIDEPECDTAAACRHKAHSSHRLFALTGCATEKVWIHTDILELHEVSRLSKLTSASLQLAVQIPTNCPVVGRPECAVTLTG